MKRLTVCTLIAAVFLFAVPALALDRAIVNGVDLWRTPGDGTTFADFSKEFLPAGFFCPGSAPFTGQVVLKGIPIATAKPGALGVTDTIIQRLDNATFNKRGVATTRIQMRAMQFENVAPIKTSCGDFNLKVTLDGEQPVTQMRILRDNTKGGRFFAPIFVNVRLSFTPVGRVTTEALELRKALRFPPAPNAQWLAQPGNSGLPTEGVLKVDTDSDGVPDTFLPGTTNFVAGRSAAGVKATACHTASEGQHCPVADPVITATLE